MRLVNYHAKLKCSKGVSSLVASALEHFESPFAPYLPCFQRATRSVEESARLYLHGLFKCERRNMEKMAETVSGSRYQRLRHMLSESAWDRSGVRRQLIADANVHFGYASALVINESAFAKKGEMSEGGAQQWNGQLGKTDNSQFGVFAAVTHDGVSALVDGELYLPEDWVADAERCEAAGVRRERSSAPRAKWHLP